MLVKTALRLRSQPTRFSCQASALSTKQSSIEQNSIIYDGINKCDAIFVSTIKNNQTGAATWLLVLFLSAVLITASVGLIFGYKIGYQQGYYALKAETQKKSESGELTSKELEDLRSSHKLLSNQAATAKQELTISLNNLDDLRDTQKELALENKQTAQLNELYAQIIGKKGGMPLQILGAKIEPLPENAFEYGFDVGMLSKDGSNKRLNVTLTLLNDDDFVEVPLEPTRYSINGIVRIRGRFVMPSNFKPLQVKLSLESNGQKVEQLYDWKLGAMVDSMPLSLLDLPEFDQSPILP